MAKKSKKSTTSALEIVRREMGVDARTDPNVQVYRQPFEIAQMIYDARIAAGLTQQELAELVGTRQPVISQLESADYLGHSLSMLQRIADALRMRIEVRMIPA